MKIAIVHDYLIDFGGAERVLKTLHEMYPDAPIYTLIADKKKVRKWDGFDEADIRESWFGKLPFAHRLISPFRFLLPLMWKSFDFSKYDQIITSAAWAVTKGFTTSDTKEVCYIHTPPRWLYGYDESRSWKNKWYGWVIKAYAAVVGHFLRMYDFRQAQKVDHYIANSENVAGRVEKFYRKKVDKVIYPPVNTKIFSPLKDRPSKGKYYLTGGRLVSSKNFDLVIKAFNELGLPLKIYGSGREQESLKSISKDNIEFLGKVSEKELVKLYQKANAYIVAQKDEDFGITPVEAMAAGTPVIAYRGGGYTESVVENKTGVFFEELSTEAIRQTVKDFDEKGYKNIKSKKCIKQAEKFSEERFKKEFEIFVSETFKG